MHSSPSWTEPYMLNTRAQLSPKHGNKPTSVSNSSLTTLLSCCPPRQKIIHSTEAILHLTTVVLLIILPFYYIKKAVTREIKMILVFHLETMDFSSTKRTETIIVLSLQILQWKWGRIYYVAVLMHCFDEATEMPLATYVKSLHTAFCIKFSQRCYLIFVAVYRECNKLICLLCYREIYFYWLNLFFYLKTSIKFCTTTKPCQLAPAGM